MRHRKAGKQLSRNSSHRRALLRNITTSLLKHEQIETTETKAKSVRPIAEKMITLAKRGDLHARRQALSFLQDKAVAHKLFEELKDRFLDRQGGYVRIIKKGNRKGDGAPVSIVQLVPKDDVKKAIKKKGSKRKEGKDIAADRPADPAKGPEDMSLKSETAEEKG
jgi:large subunit ribosomal protein L17